MVRNGGTTLEAMALTCNQLEVKAEEHTDRVILSATTSGSQPRTNCATVDGVDLDEPLGQRTLIDQRTGSAIETR
jgi:hypothetical protein